MTKRRIMTKKQILKSLARYPDDAVIGVLHLDDFVIEGGIHTKFRIEARSHVKMDNVFDAYKDQFRKCHALIIV